MTTFNNILEKLHDQKNKITQIAQSLEFKELKIYFVNDSKLHFLVNDSSEKKEYGNLLKREQELGLLLGHLFLCEVVIHTASAIEEWYLQDFLERSISINESEEKIIDFVKELLGVDEGEIRSIKFEENENDSMFDNEHDDFCISTFFSDRMKRLGLSFESDLSPVKEERKTERPQEKPSLGGVNFHQNKKLYNVLQDILGRCISSLGEENTVIFLVKAFKPLVELGFLKEEEANIIKQCGNSINGDSSKRLKTSLSPELEISSPIISHQQLSKT